AHPADAAVASPDLRDVGQHHADPIAGPDPESRQRRREPPRQVEDLEVRVVATLEEYRGILPEFLDVAFPEDGDVHDHHDGGGASGLPRLPWIQPAAASPRSVSLRPLSFVST